jgi:hypothetical protein
VKEKFGELRFYLDRVASDDVAAVIRTAANKSRRTGEECGAEMRSCGRARWGRSPSLRFSELPRRAACEVVEGFSCIGIGEDSTLEFDLNSSAGGSLRQLHCMTAASSQPTK